jgi:hypothetical protein
LENKSKDKNTLKKKYMIFFLFARKATGGGWSLWTVAEQQAAKPSSNL